MTGVIWAAAILLAAAGISKLRPGGSGGSALAAAAIPGTRLLDGRAAVRLAGIAELVLAGLILIVGGRPAAILVALSFTVLAGMSLRIMTVATGQDCGCFGAPTAMTHWHTAVNVGFALAGVVAIALSPTRLWSELGTHPGNGSALLAAAIGLAYVSFLLMTVLPELLKIATPSRELVR
jgi:hypothetical protein